MATNDSIKTGNLYITTHAHEDFIVGEDDFSDVEINRATNIGGFYYFTNQKKGLIKRFILKRTKVSEKICVVTLIRSEDGSFHPRFEYSIRNLSRGAIEQLEQPVVESETRLVKACVNLDDCHEAHDELMSFLRGLPDIDFAAPKYAVVASEHSKVLRDVLPNIPKEEVLKEVAERFGHALSEDDLSVLTKRKSALERFEKLLHDPEYFEKYREWLRGEGKSHRPEDVWQHFFENNRWIFGYGLELVSAEGLDDRKLETIVAGADIVDGAGKRIDGLMKTRGAINKALFIEIKRHDVDLLEGYDRPGVYVPTKDVRGAVAQVQKTVHKVTLKLNKAVLGIVEKGSGDPTGEQVAFIRPRSVVVVGQLSEFQTEYGINEEKLASFELYRQQIGDVELITYDELYERAQFIVKKA